MRLIHKENEGLCRTLNRGIGHARGEFVAFLASDDKMHSSKLQREVAFIKSSGDEVAGCYGDMQLMDESGNLRGVRSMGPRDKSKDLYIDMILGKNTITLQSCLFARDALVRTGDFDQSLRFEDLDFMLRFVRDYRLVYVEGISVLYRDTPESLAKKLPDYSEDYVAIARKHADGNRLARLGRYGDRKIYSYTWLRIASVKLMGAKGRLEVASSALNAIRYWPLNFRAMTVLGLAIIPTSVADNLLSVRRRLRRALKRRVQGEARGNERNQRRPGAGDPASAPRAIAGRTPFTPVEQGTGE
jgi:glycosyltransferase involved in cell wall biosynthesis